MGHRFRNWCRMAAAGCAGTIAVACGGCDPPIDPVGNPGTGTVIIHHPAPVVVPVPAPVPVPVPFPGHGPGHGGGHGFGHGFGHGGHGFR